MTKLLHILLGKFVWFKLAEYKTLAKDEIKLLCRIDNDSFSYDYYNENEYKNSKLIVYECGIEIFSAVVRAKHSDESIKLDTWAIVLIIIAVS